MEKRPEPALSLQDYKDDAKARWAVHLYEWEALLKDCKWMYEYLKPKAKKVDKYFRARNEKGQLMGDDPSTPNVNEAWVGGKAPKRRGRPKGSKNKPKATITVSKPKRGRGRPKGSKNKVKK